MFTTAHFKHFCCLNTSMTVEAFVLNAKKRRKNVFLKMKSLKLFIFRKSCLWDHLFPELHSFSFGNSININRFCC